MLSIYKYWVILAITSPTLVVITASVILVNMQKGGGPMDVIWTKLNRMVDGSITAQCNHIGRMKKYYKKCVKQPRSSEPQQNMVCDPVTVSQPMPAQQAKRPAALQFGPDPPRAKKRQADLNSHVVQTPAATKDDRDDQIVLSSCMRCGLQQLLPKMTWMTRLC